MPTTGSGAPPWGKGAHPSSDPLIGRVIGGRFMVLQLIDRGGMAKVYRAEQASLGRQVALKVLDPSFTGHQNPEFERRFYLEASACSKLKHPNTVTIFDYGATPNDIFYIAMELLEGHSLVPVLCNEAPLPPARTVHIARQVARSLREAHEAGIVHRDLKPANIFLVGRDDDPDFVKVLDFGLVKDLSPDREDLTETGLFLGTPKYMAPEQIRGLDVDARCDVYALGVVLHEMLSGQQLFSGAGTVDVLMAQLHQPVPSIREVDPDSDVPEELEALVMRCLAKEPGERFASMNELLSEIRVLGRPGGPLPLALDDPSINGPVLDPSRARLTPLPRHRRSAPGESSDIDALPTIEIGSISEELSRRAVAPDAVEPRRRGRLVKLAIAAALLVAASAWVVLIYQGGPANSTVPQAPASATGASLAAQAGLRLLLRSTPPGAAVHAAGERLCAATPCEIEWEAGRAKQGTDIDFRFVLRGLPVVTVSKRIDGDTIEVFATLSRSQERRRRARTKSARASSAKRKRPAKAAQRENGLNGYKDNPYD